MLAISPILVNKFSKKKKLHAFSGKRYKTRQRDGLTRDTHRWPDKRLGVWFQHVRFWYNIESVKMTLGTFQNGAVECRRMFCPPVNCSEDSLPVHVNGTCCKKCRCEYKKKCLFVQNSFSSYFSFSYKVFCLKHSLVINNSISLWKEKIFVSLNGLIN